MTVHRASFSRAAAAVGATLAVAGVSPANAATLNLPLAPTDYVLGALLVVLIAALIVTLARGHRAHQDAPISGSHDMRWWKSGHP